MQPDNLVVDIGGPNSTCMEALSKAEYLKVTVYVNNTDTAEHF